MHFLLEVYINIYTGAQKFGISKIFYVFKELSSAQKYRKKIFCEILVQLFSVNMS